MAQYIDKSALVAEIERLKECNRKICAGDFDFLKKTYPEHYYSTEIYNDILSFLDTLEVKEEILDKENKTKLMQKCVHKAYKRGYDMGVLQTTNKINHNMKDVDLEKEIKKYIQDNICGHLVPGTEETAKHFFELGLKAQKGE